MTATVWAGEVLDSPVYLDACVIVSAFWQKDPLFEKAVKFIVCQLEANSDLVVSLLGLNEAFAQLCGNKYKLFGSSSKRRRADLRRASNQCRRLLEVLDSFVRIIGADGTAFEGTLRETLSALEHVQGQFKDGWHYSLATACEASSLVTTNARHFGSVPAQSPFKVIILK